MSSPSGHQARAIPVRQVGVRVQSKDCGSRELDSNQAPQERQPGSRQEDRVQKTGEAKMEAGQKLGGRQELAEQVEGRQLLLDSSPEADTPWSDSSEQHGDTF